MNSTGLLDWLFLASGWSLAAVGLLLLLWALFRDRARGRARCPKCWYELTGVPRREDGGGTCPECGRGWTRAKELSRTRRKWWWAVAAVIVGVVGVGIAKVPDVRAAGWARAVPMSVLTVAAPLKSWPAISTAGQSAIARQMGGPAPTPPPIGQQLDEEAWQRVADGKAWEWQARLVVSRWFGHNGFRAEDFFVAPVRWPEGEPVPVYFRPTGPGWAGGAVFLSSDVPRTDTIIQRDERVTYPVTGMVRGDDAVRATVWFRVGDRPVRAGRVALACAAVARGELLDRLDGPGMNAKVCELLDPRLRRWRDRAGLITSDRDSGAAWNAVEYAVAFKVELVRGGAVIGRRRGMANWDYPVWKTWEEVEWEEGARPSDADLMAMATEPAGASIRVSGDVERAIADYVRWPFSKTRPAAWAGSFEVGVRVEAEDSEGPRRGG